MRINDNSYVEKAKVYEEIPKLIKKIENKTLAQLENEGLFVFPETSKYLNDLEEEQVVIETLNNCYHTGNIIGFLGLDKERLVISSRFASEENDYFLQYMMEKVLDFPNVFDLETESNTGNKFVDILIFLFPLYLKVAMRKGLFKNYIKAEYNDANPKGSINVARHIKLNVPFFGKIAYDQRELSFDNDMSQLIRHTIEHIKTKKFGLSILAKVKDEASKIIEVTPQYRFQDRQKVLSKNKKSPLRHAYFFEYRALQQLCIMILQHQKQEMGLGVNKVYGVLFDAAWLWEEYLNTLVNDEFYHAENKSHKGAEQLFSCIRKEGLIYPDFLSMRVDNRVVADAKYKPNSNIRNKDYFQVLAYMMRFGSRTGIYFYPEANQTWADRLWLNEGSSHEKNSVKAREDIRVIKLGLGISKAKNYKEFAEEMRKSEESFKDKVKEILR